MANGLFNLKQVMQGIQQGGWPAQKPPAVEYLVVAGGGGGGAESGGGGGAGGLLQGIDPVPNGQTLLVTVGAAGTGRPYSTAPYYGGDGGNSVFGSVIAAGGGGGGKDGGGSPVVAPSGGSGGGGGMRLGFGGGGLAGQGNAGGSCNSDSVYAAAGGGGAGTPGLDRVNGSTTGTIGPGVGGVGVASAISGSVTVYAGGGGGGVYVGTGQFGPALGGPGGGGAGAQTPSTSLATAGTANTGGGGGGGGSSTSTAYSSGANGGSGIVIVSYPDVYAAPTATTGSPTVSTSGSGSVAFSSSAYIRYAGQSAFAFGTGDFTIEGWFYVTSLASGIIAWDFRTAGVNGAYGALELSANGQVQYYANSAYQISSSAGLNTINTWAHIAITRSGTSTKLFFNGTQVGSTYSDSTNYLVGVSSPYIGSGSSPSAYLPGYISNFRVVKGTAVYTANFTPSTAPLTAISGTSLLLNSVSGAYLADGSTNSFVPAATAGTVAWNALSPFTVTGYKNRVYTWTSSGSITF